MSEHLNGCHPQTCVECLTAERDALAAQVAASVPLINMLGNQGHDSADTLRAAAAWLKAAGRE